LGSTDWKRGRWTSGAFQEIMFGSFSSGGSSMSGRSD
jgi:hypothetical protein